MKKLVASITVLVYFAMSSGVVINLHYCMGRVQSIDFYASKKEYCGKCGMPISKTHGCCKDEVKIIKLQDDQNKTSINISIKSIDVPAGIPSEFIAASFHKAELASHYNSNSPPSLTGQDTYLQNCVFRI